jgi:hypothetical protein
MCQTNFTIDAGVPFTPSSTSSQGTATVTATATPSSSSTTCAPVSGDSAQSSCSEPVRTVGLAVGIPLGALAAFLAAVIFWQHRKYTSTTPVASAPSQGYPASTYTAAGSSTMYGTETTMSQHYPQYNQQQPEWKPQPSHPPAELHSAVPMHELQES